MPAKLKYAFGVDLAAPSKQIRGEKASVRASVPHFDHFLSDSDSVFSRRCQFQSLTTFHHRWVRTTQAEYFSDEDV